ncbi:coiled-coil domain-containing protein 137-like [Mercenaria mercenaria]|uniref:coiled-coil domain-containing protein 137-like n=1 Tax=Mercenaria mercenaria TaxID=6596 RepID=UPI00234F9A19|nr:coiled-coil domain-containing protein 137-like [Mercenaria mercenaria]
MERGVSKPMAPIPKFVQGKREKDKDFIRRIELETHRVIMKTQMEEKYQMEIPDGSSNIASSQGKKKPSERKREKDKERKKKKVQAMKEKKQEKAGDFSAFKDDVAFGEVAMAPPSITAKPRKANMDSDKPRPGKRSLLLKEMMDAGGKSKALSTEQSDAIVRIRPKSQAQRQAGQTVKRKYLSPVQKQITDFQRQKAIDLYREMKDQKLKAPR